MDFFFTLFLELRIKKFKNLKTISDVKFINVQNFIFHTYTIHIHITHDTGVHISCELDADLEEFNLAFASNKKVLGFGISSTQLLSCSLL